MTIEKVIKLLEQAIDELKGLSVPRKKRTFRNVSASDVNEIIAYYQTLILPPTCDDTAVRAVKRIRILLRFHDKGYLLSAIDGYKRQIAKNETRLQYRKRCGNFFYGDCWKEYLSKKEEKSKSRSICPHCNGEYDEDNLSCSVEENQKIDAGEMRFEDAIFNRCPKCGGVMSV